MRPGLTPFEKRSAQIILSSFGPALSKGTASEPHSPPIDYVHALTRMRRGARGRAAFGLRIALWMVLTSPLWMFKSPKLLTRVSEPVRENVLRALLLHRAYAVRELTMLLKLVASFALLGDGGVRAQTGYDPAMAQNPSDAERRRPL